MISVKKFFTKEEKEHIVEAIREAEKETSGEIRLHLETVCKGDPLERAMKLFQKLKMFQTEQRNGVIIYLAVKDRKFAIYGDKGINEVVPENFWEDVKEEMREEFVKGAFADGVVKGIRRVGEKLKEYFPYQTDDVNELSDDISFGE
ncbi:MAG TPA: TPM domain-containing protein [Caldithrix abyssi]|uniref:TPM domain-containing protein n=1 Tax=Caldithrix abyssi TaxID=187145 RepID=A0A7V4UFX0_CALAY|nr:TPM domain-containing protein [Caldithrix abyssi]